MRGDEAERECDAERQMRKAEAKRALRAEADLDHALDLLKVLLATRGRGISDPQIEEFLHEHGRLGDGR